MWVDRSGSSAPAVGLGGCPTPKPGWRLTSGTSSLPVRCRRRSCRYCGLLAAREDVELVLADARENGPPTAVVELTSRTTKEDVLTRELTRLWRCVREDVGAPVEYALWLEWTAHTRLAHAHALVKVDPLLVPALRRAVRKRWPWRSSVGPPRRGLEAAVNYAGGLSGGKSWQRPPSTWRGRRFRSSRSYFDAPVRELRDQVGRRRRRERWERLLLEGAPAGWPSREKMARMLAAAEVDRVVWRPERVLYDK